MEVGLHLQDLGLSILHEKPEFAGRVGLLVTFAQLVFQYLNSSPPYLFKESIGGGSRLNRWSGADQQPGHNQQERQRDDPRQPMQQADRQQSNHHGVKEGVQPHRRHHWFCR